MKKYLLTGLVVLLPLALTIMVITLLFDLFTEPFLNMVRPIIQMIPAHFPDQFAIFLSRLLSFIFLCIFILLLGFLVQSFLIKSIMNAMNELLYRIPFIKTVYRVSKDIFAALFSIDGQKAFKRPLKIPFPGKPTYAIGFEVGAVAKECQEKIKTPLTAIFCPTAPHPISGFFFLAPTAEILPLNMNNEDALKYLVSCGMILPATESEGSHG